jgi:hypothetical protein
MATSSGAYVGIDVSKDRLDVAILGERQEKQVENRLKGISELVKWKPREGTSGQWWRLCFWQVWPWRW